MMPMILTSLTFDHGKSHTKKSGEWMGMVHHLKGWLEYGPTVSPFITSHGWFNMVHHLRMTVFGPGALVSSVPKSASLGKGKWLLHVAASFYVLYMYIIVYCIIAF